MYYSKHVCVYIKAIFRQSTLSLYFLILKCFCICARTQESKQAVSVANTQSIINSLLLSFPWSNHSTQQQWIPGSRSLDQWLLLLLLPLWEKPQSPKETHSQIPQTVGASGPVWLNGPAPQEKSSHPLPTVMDTWLDSIFCFFTFLLLSLKALKFVVCVALKGRANYRATFFFFKLPWIWHGGWNSWSILALCRRNLVLHCW